MKLGLTFSPDIIKKKFDIDDKYDTLRQRVKSHKVVLSNELEELWENEIAQSLYKSQYQNWYFSIISHKDKFEKIKIEDTDVNGTKNEDEKVIISTGKNSKDKIIVGISSSLAMSNNRDIKFITERTFVKDKGQIVNIADIENVYKNSRYDRLFDIYETPIRLEVRKGSSADLLSEYLSIFYRDSNNIKIIDQYLNNLDNQANFKKYILPYISDKENCNITLITDNVRDVKSKLENYGGYNIDVRGIPDSQGHPSIIESDKYIIDLGYRLKLFGKNGKTEHEIVKISRK